jgi:RNA polymerase sigma-70 factor (family 1)
MPDMRSHSDDELIALLKEGDHDALAELHNRYYGILYAHAYKRFPFREEVRDILQELFTYLWHQREQLTIRAGLPAYLYTAVRNRLFKLYRHQKVRAEYAGSLQDYLDRGDNTTENQVSERELVEVIEKEISALPPQMRLIFELSRNSELSHNEIAEKLNLSPHTVRTQVRNALRILRSKLGANSIFLFF